MIPQRRRLPPHELASPRKRFAPSRLSNRVETSTFIVDCVGNLPAHAQYAVTKQGAASGVVSDSGWACICVGSSIFVWEQPLLQPDGEDTKDTFYPRCYELEGPAAVVSLAAAAAAGGAEVVSVSSLGLARYWGDARMPQSFAELPLDLQGEEEPQAITRIGPGDYACGHSSGAVIRFQPAAGAAVRLGENGGSGGVVGAARLAFSRFLGRRAAGSGDGAVVALVAAPLPGGGTRNRKVALLAMTPSHLRLWRLPQIPPRTSGSEDVSALAPAWEVELADMVQSVWSSRQPPRLVLLQRLPGAAAAAASAVGKDDHLVLLTEAGPEDAGNAVNALQLLTIQIPELATAGAAATAVDAAARRRRGEEAVEQEEGEQDEERDEDYAAAAARGGQIEISEPVWLTLGSLAASEQLIVGGLAVEPPPPPPPPLPLPLPATSMSSLPRPPQLPLQAAVKVHVVCQALVAAGSTDSAAAVVTVNVPLAAARGGGGGGAGAKVQQTLARFPLPLLPGCVAAGAPPGGEGIVLLSPIGEVLWYRHVRFAPPRALPRATPESAGAATPAASLEVDADGFLQVAADAAAVEALATGAAPVDVGGLLEVPLDAAAVEAMAQALGRALQPLLEASAAPGSAAAAAAASPELAPLRRALDPHASPAARAAAEAAVVAASRAIVDSPPSAGFGWAAAAAAGGAGAAGGSAATAGDAASAAATGGTAAVAGGGFAVTGPAGGSGGAPPIRGGGGAAEDLRAAEGLRAVDGTVLGRAAGQWREERQLVSHALEDKLRRHRALVALLHNAGLWQPLTAARAALVEHGERLAAAATLCNCHAQAAARAGAAAAAAETAVALAGGIEAALERRGWNKTRLLTAGLSADDVYYSAVSANDSFVGSASHGFSGSNNGFSDRNGGLGGPSGGFGSSNGGFSGYGAGVLEALLQALRRPELQLPGAQERGTDALALLEQLAGLAGVAAGTLEAAESFREAEKNIYRSGPRARPWTGTGAARQLLRGLLQLHLPVLARLDAAAGGGGASGASAGGGTAAAAWRKGSGALVLRLARPLLAGFAVERSGLAAAAAASWEEWATGYEDAKAVVFACLRHCRQRRAAQKLMREHCYFDGLMMLCFEDDSGGDSDDSSGGLEELRRLMRELAGAESTAERRLPFPAHAVLWLYERQRLADLLVAGSWEPARQPLRQLLSARRDGDALLWPHLLGAGEYGSGAETLWRVAGGYGSGGGEGNGSGNGSGNGTVALEHRRQLLALCKLCKFAEDGEAAAAAAVAPPSDAALEAALLLANAQESCSGGASSGREEPAEGWREVVGRLEHVVAAATDAGPAAAAAVCAIRILEDVASGAGSRHGENGAAAADAQAAATRIWSLVARATASLPAVEELIRRADGAAGERGRPTDPEIEYALRGSLLQVVKARAAAAAAAAAPETAPPPQDAAPLCGSQRLLPAAVRSLGDMPGAVAGAAAYSAVLLRCP